MIKILAFMINCNYILFYNKFLYYILPHDLLLLSKNNN